MVKNKHTARSSTPSRRRAYERKRNLTATPEPGWSSAKRSQPKTGRLYVIQKHAARRLHYDLRLEIDGALASWAVPKGFPMEHDEKHLAIKVEDHPLDYANFEGNIPAGNYGAGAVMLWDRGLYEVLEKTPAEALRKGHLSLVFAGEKLQGNWNLVRTRHGTADKEEWLLLKGKENTWTLPPEEDDRSVASNRTLAQIANDAEPAPAPTSRSKKKTSPLLKKLPTTAPAFTAPMKPFLSSAPPRGDDWIYEIKFDGYRVLAIKDGPQTTLYSRNRKDVTRDFATLQSAIQNLPAQQLAIDGEVVALLESGIPSFQLLQNRGRANRDSSYPIFYYAFDLLNLEGHDTTGLPLRQRKELLQNLFSNAADPLRFSASIDTDPEIFLAQAEQLGLEGLIAKEKESLYEVGRRSRSWLKIKIHHQHEFVIGGYTEPQGSRSHFGSLIVGVHENRKLHFVGRVGSGFDEPTLKTAYEHFQPLRVPDCPFANLPTRRKSSFGGGLTATDMKRCAWLKPKLVCEVRFSGWTDDGSLRHPVFLGFRDDKPPREIIREKPL